MVRFNFFHLLTGVWQDGAFGASIWAQIATQLKNGGTLNESERAVLAELLKRMQDRPEARKALGIRPRSRTAERNDAIADHYVHLTAALGKSAKEAEFGVREKFPKVGARAIRSVIESRENLAAARVRVIARIHLADKPPTK